MRLETKLNEITMLTEIQLINKLFDLKFICREVFCKYCNQLMILKPKNDCIDKYNWRCLHFKCKSYQTTQSIRSGSWMDTISICAKKLLKILLLWSQCFSSKNILSLINISNKTFLKIRKILLKHVACYFEINPIKLGGPGICVQIDETILNHKVKAHRGLGPRKQIWCLSIADTSFSPSRCYFSIVPNREKRTLLPIISNVVRSGSIIYTDEFKSYNDLKNLNNYEHKSVCHKYNFVEPITGVHTQHVESLNNQLKCIIKCVKVIKEEFRELFIMEFMFLDLFKNDSHPKICELLRMN